MLGGKSAFMKRLSVLMMVMFIILSMIPQAATQAFAETKDAGNAGTLGKAHVIVENKTFSKTDGANWSGVLVDTDINIQENSTMMSLILAALDSVGAKQEGAENNYIKSINDLSEKEGGDGSGWMATLNDWFVNRGLLEFSAKKGDISDGDLIHVQYTKDLGADLGGKYGDDDRTVKMITFSSGKVEPAFEKDIHQYTLTVPKGIDKIKVTPTASNKNYQVKTFVGDTEYKRTKYIPISDGTRINVKCGDKNWPSMSPMGDAQEYEFTVKKETDSAKNLYLEDMDFRSAIGFAASGTKYKMSPEFSSDVFEYTLDIADCKYLMGMYALLKEDTPSDVKMSLHYKEPETDEEKSMDIKSGAIKAGWNMNVNSVKQTLAYSSLKGADLNLRVGTDTDFVTYTFHIKRYASLKTLEIKDGEGKKIDHKVAKYKNGTEKIKEDTISVPKDIELELVAEAGNSDSKVKINGQETTKTKFKPTWNKEKSDIEISVSDPLNNKDDIYVLHLLQIPNSIEITSPPSKTEYKFGEKFDPTGMVVKANFGTESRVLTQEEYSIKPERLNADTIKEVEISYRNMSVKQPVKVSFTEAKMQGSGTEKDPWIIKNVDHLKSISAMVEMKKASYEGKYFKIDRDITLPTNWTPIGISNRDVKAFFAGNIDGNNKTITIPRGESTMLGYTHSASLKNLNIYGERIEGTGVVKTYATGTPGPCINIENVTLKAGTNTTKSGFIGGYSHGNATINIRNCTVEKGVTVGCDGNESYVGSFGGEYNGSIDGCVSYATVKGKSFLGGILADKGQTMGPCIVRNCKFYGNIEATGDYVGGIMGCGYGGTVWGWHSAPNSPLPSIQNCIMEGNVKGRKGVGGILGAECATMTDVNNGIGLIQNNFVTGKITGESSVGGIVGLLENMGMYFIIQNNYYAKNDNLPWIGKAKAVNPDRKDDPIGKGANAIGKAISKDDITNDALFQNLIRGFNSLPWISEGGTPVLSDGRYVTEIKTTAIFNLSPEIINRYDYNKVNNFKFTINYSDGTKEEVSSTDGILINCDPAITGKRMAYFVYKNMMCPFAVDVQTKENKTGEIPKTVRFRILGDTLHDIDDENYHSIENGKLNQWGQTIEFMIAKEATAKDIIERGSDALGVKVDWGISSATKNTSMLRSPTESSEEVKSATYRDGITLNNESNKQADGNGYGSWRVKINDKIDSEFANKIVEDKSEVLLYFENDVTLERVIPILSDIEKTLTNGVNLDNKDSVKAISKKVKMLSPFATKKLKSDDRSKILEMAENTVTEASTLANKIEVIEEVTKENLEEVEALVKRYEQANEEVKKLIPDTLKNKIEAMKKKAPIIKHVIDFEKRVENIGNVTLEKAPLILALNTEFKAMTEEESNEISKEVKTTLRNAIDALSKQRVNDIQTRVSKLGYIDSKNVIEAEKLVKDFKSLSDEEKAMLSIETAAKIKEIEMNIAEIRKAEKDKTKKQQDARESRDTATYIKNIISTGDQTIPLSSLLLLLFASSTTVMLVRRNKK